MACEKQKKAVSVELITDSETAMKEVGLSFEENSLYCSINLEAPRDRTPVLVKTSSNEYYLIARNVEMGNYLPDGCAYDIVSKQNIKVHTYAKYFTMTGKEDNERVAPNEPAALYDLLPVDTITVNSDMPLARYNRYREKFTVGIKPSTGKNDAVYVYEVDKMVVASLFSEVAPEDKEAALKLMKEMTHAGKEDLDLLKKYMNVDRLNQFDSLDDLMNQKGIKYILADTRLTVHTFTALPWDEIGDGKLLALYDGKKVMLISPEPISKDYIILQKKYDNFAEAIKMLVGNESVGVEGMSLPVEKALTIGLDKVFDVTLVLSLWRDRFAHQTLPHYIINSLANRYAMENALLFAEEGLNSGKEISERDIENKFIELLGEFKQKYNLGHLDFKKYFVVLHAGARSPYPALSSNYKIHKNMKTLKLDAGVFVLKDGILLSGSDLCRTITLNDGGKEVYRILQDNIRNNVIPNIKPGMTGEDVYWLGLKPLSELEGKLKDMDMLAKEFNLKEGYNRDIGHTIDKEESRTVSVEKKHVVQPWEALMLGCIEYQWPYKDYAIGIEDMFFVTPDKTINITY